MLSPVASFNFLTASGSLYYVKGKVRSANLEVRGCNCSANIKDDICPEILDKFEVMRRCDGGHLVAGEFCELDRILADRRRSSIDEKPRANGGSLVTRLGKPQGLRSVQGLDGSVQAGLIGSVISNRIATDERHTEYRW